MKKNLFKVIAIVVSLLFISTLGFAADPKAPAVEMPKGKVFVNKSPAFSFIYPSYAVEKPLEVPTEVLRVAGVIGLPAFVCTVDDAPKDATLKKLPQAGFEGLQKDPRYAAKSGWALVSQKETKLADGTPAVEYEVGWDWQPRLRFYTIFVETIKSGKIKGRRI